MHSPSSRSGTGEWAVPHISLWIGGVPQRAIRSTAAAIVRRSASSSPDGIATP